jgi:hypothetical protein
LIFTIKVKVKLSLCLIKHHAMKMYKGVEVWLRAFIISALDGRERTASHPGHFIPGERAPGTNWIAADLATVEKRELLPVPGIEP